MLRVWVVAGLALLIGWSPALADRKKDKKDKDKAKEEPAVVAPVDPVEAEYRRYVEEGLREFNAANYEEALALFDKAYAVKPTARVLRGIGKVQFELKQYAKAVGTLDAALASTADPLADTLREEVTSLRERALRFTGVVKAKVVPATAEILLDGKPLAAAAAAAGVRVDIGTHLVEASAPGYLPKRRSVELIGGDERTAEIELDEIQAGGGKTMLYAALGLDVLFTAATVASIALFVDRSGAVNDCQDAFDAGATCANAEKLASQRNVAIGMLTVSTVGLAASAVFTYFVIKKRRGRKVASPTETAVSCTPLVGGAFCGASVSF